MKQTFIDRKFKPATLEVIKRANVIIDEYAAQGFTLTLRQLYYQFVRRNWITNTRASYNRLGTIVSDGRLAGYIDWSAIEDRTRNVRYNAHFDSPSDAVRAVHEQYGIDMWANQPFRVEVWIEKEALIGVIERVCKSHDVPFFACRGYVSQSEQYAAGMRARSHFNRGSQETVILHLGDHDPSGIDMTRDNTDRLALFAGYRGKPHVERIALNMEQVNQYQPPRNPAKVTDTRFKNYSDQYGEASWELDALEPRVIADLIDEHVMKWRDHDQWLEMRERVTSHRSRLEDIYLTLRAEEDEHDD